MVIQYTMANKNNFKVFFYIKKDFMAPFMDVVQLPQG